MSLGVFLQSRLSTRIQLISLHRQLDYSKQTLTQFYCGIFTVRSLADDKCNADMFFFVFVFLTPDRITEQSHKTEFTANHSPHQMKRIIIEMLQ